MNSSTGCATGRAASAGESGGFQKLTRDIYVIAYELMREKSWTTLLSPLALAIPAFTFNNYIQEYFFSRRWAAQILDQPESRKRPHWIAVPQRVAEESI